MKKTPPTAATAYNKLKEKLKKKKENNVRDNEKGSSWMGD